MKNAQSKNVHEFFNYILPPYLKSISLAYTETQIYIDLFLGFKICILLKEILAPVNLLF